MTKEIKLVRQAWKLLRCLDDNSERWSDYPMVRQYMRVFVKASERFERRKRKAMR